MQEVNDATELMSKVVEQVKQSKTFHVIANIRTGFGGGVLPVLLKLGSVRLEGWYRKPQWRFELSHRRERWISVWAEACDYTCVFSHGRWTKRIARVEFHPDKLRLFGLERTDTVTCRYGENRVQEDRVWMIQGLGDRGERYTWWIGKDDLVVRKLEKRGGYIEFEHGGARKRVRVPGVNTLEFRKVEFDPDLPDELFVVPPDAPFEESVADIMMDLFEQLLAQEAGGAVG